MNFCKIISLIILFSNVFLLIPLYFPKIFANVIFIYQLKKSETEICEILQTHIYVLIFGGLFFISAHMNIHYQSIISDLTLIISFLYFKGEIII